MIEFNYSYVSLIITIIISLYKFRWSLMCLITGNKVNIILQINRRFIQSKI